MAGSMTGTQCRPQRLIGRLCVPDAHRIDGDDQTDRGGDALERLGQVE
jgi:hypothetical protein